MVKNWKTTLAGLVVGIPLILHGSGVDHVGHVGSTDWLGIVSGIGALFMGAYSKDHNVTGGSVQQ